MSQVHELTQKMLDGMTMGDMGVSFYDAACLARVREPDRAESAFPEVLNWMRRAQRPDGSWGGDIEYYPARILATLAAILTLAELKPDILSQRQVEWGLEYLRHAWPLRRQVAYDTIGFEILVPRLLEDGCRLGLPLAAYLAEARRLSHSKLDQLPPDLIYSPKVSIGFSLEFLGNQLDPVRARGLQLANGSIGCSVAATAHYVRLTNDPRALAYLRDIEQRFGPECIPFGYPEDTFEKLWVLYNLHLGGLVDEMMPVVRPHLDYLHRAWGPDGMGWSSVNPLVDSDETAMALLLLHAYGYNVDTSVLAPYERDTHFACFFFERDPSISANIHILEMLNGCPYQGRDAAIQKLLDFLWGTRINAMFWDDKWHISPYYATSHAIIAVAPQSLEMAETAVRWIEEMQNDDGSWGFYDQPTAEESAYCLQALLAFQRHAGEVSQDVIHRGSEFIYRHLEDASADIPALWIAKSLYCPINVVRSALLGALAMYEADYKRVLR